MLEPILKGLVEWLYQLMVDIMGYASGELLGVMSMDLSYFETTAPIISEIVDVFIALGWALLIGNLVFQMLKVMMSGAGFEAEDPKILFMRTFVFAFLLLASRQICEIGSSMTGTVINMLELPGSIEVKTPDESMFSLGGEAKWLLVIIVGVVLMVQMVKLLFEIGERYVITSVLTFFAPLAFSMGGSKNTNDIFKGWCRMYGSMLVMMIMNIVFLKLIMSAMSRMNSGGVLIWLVFVVALTRVARKIDSHIGKIGLNPAQTGSGIGSRLPGMMTMMAVRVMSSTVSRSLANAKGGQGTGGRGYGRSGAGGRPGAAGHGGAAGGSSTPKHAGRNSGVGTPVPSGQEGVFRTGNTTVHSGSRISGRSDSYGGETNMNIGGVQEKQNTQSSQNVQNRTAQPGGSRTQVGRPGADAGGTVLVSGSSDMNQQSYQTQNQAGAAKQRQITPGMRPPIPRGTAGTMQTSRIQQSVQSNQDSPGGQSGTRTRSGTASRREGMVSISAPQIHSQQQSVSRSNRQNGNQSAVISGEAQSHTDISGSVRQSNQGSSRDMRSASYGGAAGDVMLGGRGGNVNVNGSQMNVGAQMYANQSNLEQYAGGTERFRTEHTRQFTQRIGRTETAEQRRINHEYSRGKYNPASVNRKQGQTYYQKDSGQRYQTSGQGYYQDRQYRRNSTRNQRKEGGTGGKHRRKK